MKLYIEVSGGIVTAVYADSSATVEVIDHDNISAGDEYAIEAEKRFLRDKDGMIEVY